jgi:hypothetical protein
MNFTKTLGVLAVAATALMAFAGTASATTLSTNGVPQSGAVTLEMSLSGSTTLKDTSGSFANTCTAMTIKGTTTVFTGTTVSGPISTLAISKCTHEPVIVHQNGSFSIERIGTTTNGTLRLSGAIVTYPVTIFGSTVTATCTTSNTAVGTLTGRSSGTSTVDMNAVVNCGSFLPSAQWQGTWNITGHSIAVEA